VRILFVPPNDWMTHPTPMRHHFLFKRIAKSYRCEVYVLNLDGLGRSRTIHNPDLVLDENIQLVGKHSLSAANPALYYVLNSKHTCNVIRHAIKELQIDIVVNSNLLPGAIAAKMAQRAEIPIVYDCMEYYPESASSYFKCPVARSLVESSVRQLMHYVIRKSDLVITVSDSHASLVKTVDPSKRVYVVPNGVDLEMFRPSDGDRLIDRACTSSLDLVYVGSVDVWLDMVSVLKAIEILKREGLRVQLTIVGGSHGGFYIEQMKSFGRSLGLENNLTFVGFVPYRSVPDYINAADVALAPYRNVLKNDVTPLKVLEYLACQKIVLCTPVPEIMKRFGNIVYSYDGPKDLARLLRQILQHRIDFENRARNARQMLSDYSWDVLADKYHQILNWVVN